MKQRTWLLYIGLFFITEFAFADTYLVRPDGTGDFPTIQAALSAAVDGDTIELANGTFTRDGNRNLDFLGKAVTLRSQNGNPDSCTIDCQRTGRGVVFHSGEGEASVLEGVKIYNAHPDDYGGGIYCSNSSPTIRNCIIRGNKASDGAGVHCYDASPTFENCQIAGNWADSWHGGVDCYHSSPTFINCAITNNRALHGGGVGCFDSPAEFIDCTISGNRATLLGGGVHSNDASPRFVRCVISDNVTTTQGSLADGGGVFCVGGAPVFMECIIRGNQACLGGGVYCEETLAEFTNCLIKNNYAHYCGGGVYSRLYSPVFTQCTIVSNAAPHGAGLYLRLATPVFNSTIIAFSEGDGIFFSESNSSRIEYCDIFGSTIEDIAFRNGDSMQGPEGIGTISMTNANGDSCDIFYNIFLDPMFADTTSGDYHLAVGSPCIDAGDPELPLDPDSTISDIGAFYFDQVAVDEPPAILPSTYALHPNYPNPFNPTTNIRYDIPQTSHVTLTIYNLLGQQVTQLIDKQQQPGSYIISWHATHLPSGLYFCRMQAGDFIQTRKFALIK